MFDLKNIIWLGHDGFKITGDGTVIYIDPYGLKNNVEPADLILITHEHFDHLSLEDIAKVRVSATTIVAPPKAAHQLSGDVREIRPGESLTIKGVQIKAVPAYNVNKFRSPGQVFHPRENEGVGYIVTVENTRIYHAGDTDFIPEMKDFQVDIALLPVSGTYVMTPEEAAKAVDAIQPRIAIPMHYASIVGSQVEAEAFKERANTEVRIMRAQP